MIASSYKYCFLNYFSNLHHKRFCTDKRHLCRLELISYKFGIEFRGEAPQILFQAIAFFFLPQNEDISMDVQDRNTKCFRNPAVMCGALTMCQHPVGAFIINNLHKNTPSGQRGGR